MLHWVMQGYLEAFSTKFSCHLTPVYDNTGHVRSAKLMLVQGIFRENHKAVKLFPISW